VSDEVRRMLDQIVARFVVNDEVRTIDREAANISDGDAIETDKEQATRREVARHEQLFPAFEAGLLRAWERAQIGGHELLLDDRNPDQNAMADALIQLLVRFELASSRTEPTGQMHYSYYITVDWPKLKELASSADIDIDSDLRRLAQRTSR
jgi:hypothetical protein